MARDSRNRTQQRVDAHVDQHPRQRERRYIRAHCLEDDVTRQHRADQITNSRNQSDDRIETDFPRRARDRDGVVEQLRQHAHTIRAARGIVGEYATPGGSDHPRLRPAQRETFASSVDIRVGPG